MSIFPLNRSVEPLPGCDPQIGRYLWAMDEARARLLSSVQGLTVDELDARLPGADNTIGTLLYHIALVEASWLYEDTLQQPVPSHIEALFPYDDRDAGAVLTGVQGHDLPSYEQRMQAVRTELLKEFGAMSLEDFRRSRVLPNYMATPEWILHHLMQHEAEHRGHIQALRSAFGSLAQMG